MFRLGGPQEWPPLHVILRLPRRLRAFVRAHETSLVVLAAMIGTIGGLVVLAMSVAVAALHALLFNISITERLSSQPSVETLRAVLVPSLGGLLLGVALLLLLRWRPAREIDPIEANALHGGRMSFRGSVIVALQTTWSSGVGASVGLEAGYTQLASGLAASLGRGFAPAPRRPAHHGRLRSRGCDLGRVRRPARRRLLCVRTGDRRLYAGEPRAGRRRRRGGLFRHPWICRRCRSASASARSATWSGAISPLAALLGVLAALVWHPRSCAAWRCAKRGLRRPACGRRCARRSAASRSACWRW